MGRQLKGQAPWVTDPPIPACRLPSKSVPAWCSRLRTPIALSGGAGTTGARPVTSPN
jgi:hypothetical protein